MFHYSTCFARLVAAGSLWLRSDVLGHEYPIVVVWDVDGAIGNTSVSSSQWYLPHDVASLYIHKYCAVLAGGGLLPPVGERFVDFGLSEYFGGGKSIGAAKEALFVE